MGVAYCRSPKNCRIGAALFSEAADGGRPAGLRRLGQVATGQGHRYCQAALGVVAGLHGAAVQGDGTLGDSQAEAVAAAASVAGLIGAEKWLEDIRQAFFGYARAAV